MTQETCLGNRASCRRRKIYKVGTKKRRLKKKETNNWKNLDGVSGLLNLYLESLSIHDSVHVQFLQTSHVRIGISCGVSLFFVSASWNLHFAIDGNCSESLQMLLSTNLVANEEVYVLFSNHSKFVSLRSNFPYCEMGWWRGGSGCCSRDAVKQFPGQDVVVLKAISRGKVRWMKQIYDSLISSYPIQ